MIDTMQQGFSDLNIILIPDPAYSVITGSCVIGVELPIATYLPRMTVLIFDCSNIKFYVQQMESLLGIIQHIDILVLHLK